MPQRFVLAFDSARDWLVVLYEPLAFWIFAAAVATGAATVGDGAAYIEWLSLSGYAIGTIIDLAARGRAYARTAPDQRRSRWAEWKERLLWAAIGLGMGVMLSVGINGALLAGSPAWHPLVNTLCVGVVALPLIDFTRGSIRILSGQQDAFAGLVIGWARRRAGGDS